MSATRRPPSRDVPGERGTANAGARDLSFFRGIPQLDLPDHEAKSPLFLYDVAAFSVSFLVPVRRLEGLLPSGSLRALPVTLRKGLLSILVCKYRDSDLGSYNEVGILVSVLPRPGATRFPALLSTLRAYGAAIHIWQLPVTTERSRAHGAGLWGYPKFVADIAVGHDGAWGGCDVSVDGSSILKLALPLPKPRPASRKVGQLLSVRGGSVLRAEAVVNQRQRGSAFRPRGVDVSFGPHPIGRQLAGLGLGRPFASAYWPELQMILSEPFEVFPA